MTHFSARPARRDLKAVILLGIVAFCLHGHGLGLGFWLDDHNHLELCRKNGWAGLAIGNTFDWNQRIAHVWWATETTGWAYFRPFTVALRTLQLDLFGLNPIPFHIVYLSIYILSVLLLYGVIRRWGGGVGMALCAGLLFTMHPSHSMAASWLACDGPVLVGVWTFLALWILRVSLEAEHRRAAPLLGLILCYGLAMLSRESGVMLGPVLIICEWFAAGRLFRNPQQEAVPVAADISRPPVNIGNGARPGRWFLRIALAAEAIVFLLVRSHCLQGAPAPRTPYFTGPWEPGFVSWIFHKSLSDFLSLTLSLPSFPIVNVAWLQERPVTTCGLTLLSVTIAVVFLYPLRRSRVTWAIVASMALTAAPTLLTMSAAYHYYLVSAGWAVLLTMWAKQLRPRHPQLVAATLACISGLYLLGLWSGAWVLHTSASLEHTLLESVQAVNPSQFPQGTRLFFINLPLTSMESGPVIRVAAGRPDLEFCPLTLSPGPFLPDRAVTFRLENERTLLLQIEGPGWFSGQFGKQVELGWFGASGRDFKTGLVQIAPVAGTFPFRVEVVKADSQGIKAMRFIFDKPVGDPGYRFFIGTTTLCAQPLNFNEKRQEIPAQPATPHQQDVMARSRRLQIGYDSLVDFLARWP